MKDRTNILSRYNEYEDRLLVNKVFDICESCVKYRGEEYYFTDFLDPRQQSVASNICKQYKELRYNFYGGVHNSERNVCGVFSIDCDEAIEPPIEVLKISWKSNRKLSHRDFLGSLIHFGIRREKIGDILIADDSAYIAVIHDISDFLVYNFSKVGNTPIMIQNNVEEIKSSENEKFINTTVSSMRLDSILSAGFGLSRTKALEPIKTGKTFINWEEENSPAKLVREKDNITLRGKGRIVIEEIGGTTRKDRIKITLKKFI